MTLAGLVRQSKTGQWGIFTKIIPKDRGKEEKDCLHFPEEIGKDGTLMER